MTINYVIIIFNDYYYVNIILFTYRVWSVDFKFSQKQTIDKYGMIALETGTL